MQRTDSTTSSTATLRDSDYNADEALRQVRAVPTPPRRPLTAVMPDALRAIDWNGHMPSAPYSGESMTREQLDRALAEWDEDDSKPVIPKVPGQRKPSPRSNWDTADIYERPAAWNAFGSAA